MNKYILPITLIASMFLSLISPAFALTTVAISGNTSLGENQPGWMFNRDVSTDTPFEFVDSNPSIGTGSLYVQPIGANAADKMIAENFVNSPISNVNSISYDFKIGSGGDSTDKVHFYMNVYANFGVSEDLKFYDCRYSVVPTVGSTGSYTTVTFDPTQSYPVAKRGDSPFNCPAKPADMDLSSAGSNIRVFSLNVGDTSTNDLGLDGYLDNVVVNLDSGTTVYDFEAAPVDEDNDGVNDDIDLCLNSLEDEWGTSAGVNRWQLVDGTWVQNQPVKKAKGTQLVQDTSVDTKGCSATDYLTWLSDNDMGEYGGHWKYGLSSSLLAQLVKDLSDGKLDGMYHYDSMFVNSNSFISTNSTKPLMMDKVYKLMVNGTWTNSLNVADAEYASIDAWVSHFDGYDISPWFLGVNEFDLMVDGAFVDWGTYSSGHTYSLDYVGMGLPVSMMVFDGQAGVANPSWYVDNSGSLSVEIYEVL